MTNKIFAVDTNILIYLHDKDYPLKRGIAKNLLADEPYISAQVISEYLNVARRLLNWPKEELLADTSLLLLECKIVSISPQTLYNASNLVRKYDFQLFDAIVVASSLEAGAEILYSEDMHHELVVENRMTILNPFKTDLNFNSSKA